MKYQSLKVPDDVYQRLLKMQKRLSETAAGAVPASFRAHIQTHSVVTLGALIGAGLDALEERNKQVSREG